MDISAICSEDLLCLWMKSQGSGCFFLLVGATDENDQKSASRLRSDRHAVVPLRGERFSARVCRNPAQPGRLRSHRARSSSATPATAPTGSSSSSAPGHSRCCSRAPRRRRLFLDIDAKVLSGGERGLLGLAFHPQYESNGRFFVFYTRDSSVTADDGDIVIAGVRRVGGNPNVASTAETVLLTIEHPSQVATTTAACSRSIPTATCASASATAAPATTRRTTPRTSTRCSARSCASTSTSQPAGALLVAAVEPVRRRGRARRDLLDRLAQSMALQLRSATPASSGWPTSVRARAKRSTRRS